MELYKQVGEFEFVKVFNLEDYDDGIKKLLLSICKMSYDSLESVFGERNLENILSKYTFGEIREKYEAWGNRPKVGDEVKYGVHTGLVISYTKKKDYVRVLANGENSIFCFPSGGVKKTGRNFDNISIGEIGKYAEK